MWIDSISSVSIDNGAELSMPVPARAGTRVLRSGAAPKECRNQHDKDRSNQCSEGEHAKQAAPIDLRPQRGRRCAGVEQNQQQQDQRGRRQRRGPFRSMLLSAVRTTLPKVVSGCKPCVQRGLRPPYTVKVMPSRGSFRTTSRSSNRLRKCGKKANAAL